MELFIMLAFVWVFFFFPQAQNLLQCRNHSHWNSIDVPGRSGKFDYFWSLKVAECVSALWAGTLQAYCCVYLCNGRAFRVLIFSLCTAFCTAKVGVREARSVMAAIVRLQQSRKHSRAYEWSTLDKCPFTLFLSFLLFS